MYFDLFDLFVFFCFFLIFLDFPPFFDFVDFFYFSFVFSLFSFFWVKSDWLKKGRTDWFKKGGVTDWTKGGLTVWKKGELLNERRETDRLKKRWEKWLIQKRQSDWLKKGWTEKRSTHWLTKGWQTDWKKWESDWLKKRGKVIDWKKGEKWVIEKRGKMTDWKKADWLIEKGEVTDSRKAEWVIVTLCNVLWQNVVWFFQVSKIQVWNRVKRAGEWKWPAEKTLIESVLALGQNWLKIVFQVQVSNLNGPRFLRLSKNSRCALTRKKTGDTHFFTQLKSALYDLYRMLTTPQTHTWVTDSRQDWYRDHPHPEENVANVPMITNYEKHPWQMLSQKCT